MSALIAIAIFPVLTLLLVALTKAEDALGGLAEPARPALARVEQDAPTGAALPVPVPLARPQLRLVEAEQQVAA